ncbi:hypothetical protein Vretimale_4762 [Volvox reticuliferus]|uniref:Uracil-DNA glycosylase-like domain-containing protein n=1 Tax=Volvox reticuliferus TaxID=1737510 RepID=A0A8J4FEP7_9CHLO|nr:hypothetical protein Vretifemale_3367 [Volvox reticuliferus]GIL99643.1 hypothetical protein Vretimale_4762 [Volvox reticuliferus]
MDEGWTTSCPNLRCTSLWVYQRLAVRTTSGGQRCRHLVAMRGKFFLRAAQAPRLLPHPLKEPSIRPLMAPRLQPSRLPTTRRQPDSGGAGPRVHCSGGQAAQSDSVSQGGIPALVAPTSAPASSSFTTPRLTSQLLATSSFPAPLNTTLSAAATGAADPTSVSAAGTTGDPACLHPQAPPFLTGICNPTPSTSPTDTSTRRKTTRGAVRVPAATGSGATSAGRRTRSGPSNPSSSGSPLSSFLVPAPPPRGVPEKLGDRPLRLVIVGHNPSAHAWQSGHYYSHPANHMWRLLIATGIAPPGTRSAEDDDRLPAAAGVGFLDVGCGHPGTDSASFSSEVFKSWSQVFYAQLKAHMGRASASIGCSCGLCGAPSLVAFSGKRHYLELLNVDKAPRERVKSVEHGPQQLLPGGWPFPATTTEVWVCSSTSGAAALTREQRQAPYRQLAEKLRGIEWPRRVALRCAATQFGGLSNTARTSVADVAVAVKAAEEEATMGAAPENETAALGAEVKEEVEVVVIGDGDAKDDEEEM